MGWMFDALVLMSRCPITCVRGFFVVVRVRDAADDQAEGADHDHVLGVFLVDDEGS